MKWLEKVKNIVHVLINKRKTNSLILNSPQDMYANLMSNKKIKDIINSVPEDLNKLEKAYFIYIELGKILKEDPNFVFRDAIGKNINYNRKIDDRFYGICKSMSELYVSILKDERIGIEAESVNKHIGSSISHVDTILKIDGKTYICNLIGDLARIKSSRRLNSFCFNLYDSSDLSDIAYLENLESHYGKISYLERKDIETLDKKIKYSYYAPTFMKEEERGIYSDDTINMIVEEMHNLELLKKYVFLGKDIPEEEQLKYKMNYLFANIDRILDFQGESGYLENVENHRKLTERIFSFEERDRIVPYAGVVRNDYSNIISIIKLQPHPNDKSGLNIYYVFSKEKNKYEEKSLTQLRDFLDRIDSKNFKIVGNTRAHTKIDLEELEL